MYYFIQLLAPQSEELKIYKSMVRQAIKDKVVKTEAKTILDCIKAQIAELADAGRSAPQRAEESSSSASDWRGPYFPLPSRERRPSPARFQLDQSSRAEEVGVRVADGKGLLGASVMLGFVTSTV